jgi:hypothetical protein
VLRFRTGKALIHQGQLIGDSTGSAQAGQVPAKGHLSMWQATKLMAAAALLTVGGFTVAQQTQELPPGHPPMLPPAHPDIGQPAAPPSGEPASVNPQDVQTIQSILQAYYESISGPAGQPRDWGRFQTLFMPASRFITARMVGGQMRPVALVPDDYVRLNNSYFERGGYFENELNRHVDRYGTIAQVFSTYESRRGKAGSDPYSRGVNGFQLMHDGQRWWITTVIWDYERPDGEPIPPQYLPPPAPSPPSPPSGD